jgi:hypothetical protein
MNNEERRRCEGWEQQIIDGVAVGELPHFDPELMLSYWEAEGFRPEALEPLRRQFSAWYGSLASGVRAEVEERVEERVRRRARS